MRRLEESLADPQVADAYRLAHEAYLADREAIAVVPELARVSAGGMPQRVKCLHVLVAHSLAAGPGVNPLGDRALDMLPDWSAAGPCVRPGDPTDPQLSADEHQEST
jgi:hypothetical protein